jgi:competence protein ComGC
MNFRGFLIQLVISLEILIVIPSYIDRKHKVYNGNNLFIQFLNKGQSELYGV